LISAREFIFCSQQYRLELFSSLISWGEYSLHC
jgi:hypothetical protein